MLNLSSSLALTVIFVRLTPLNLSKISVNDLLKKALDSLEVPKNVKLNLPENNLQIVCDEKKMELVFINVLLNAIQAVAKKEGTITVRAKEDDKFNIIEFENTDSKLEHLQFDVSFLQWLYSFYLRICLTLHLFQSMSVL